MCFAILAPIGAAIASAVSTAASAVGTAAAAVGSAVGSAASSVGTAVGGMTASQALAAGSIASTVAATSLTVAGQIQSQKAASAANDYNEAASQQQALDAERRGALGEEQRRNQSKLIIGQMRADQGSSGVVADTGSGLDVLAQSSEYMGRDAAMTRYNNLREAQGYRTQAGFSGYESKVGEATIPGRALGTSLTGASRVFDQTNPYWRHWQNSNSP